MFHAPIQLEVVLEQDHPRVERWDERMCENIVQLDHRPYQAIKRPVFHCSGQSHAEDFQQPTNLVGDCRRRPAEKQLQSAFRPRLVAVFLLRDILECAKAAI